MQGTEKQIAWATDIINRAIDCCDANISMYTNDGVSAGTPNATEVAMGYRLHKAFCRKCADMCDAARIIKMKDMYFEGSGMTQFVRTMYDDMIAGRKTADQIAAKLGLTEY